MSLQQQGAYQGQQVEVFPINGFNAPVSFTISGLPAGVTTIPASLTSTRTPVGTAQGSPFQLFASQSATVGQSTVTVTATSGSLTHSITFPLTVIQAAPFSIKLSPTSISMSPASNKTVEVSLNSGSVAPPYLNISTSPLPTNSGTEVITSVYSLTPTNPVQLSIRASTLAQSLASFPVAVTATDQDSSNASTAIMNLTISGGVSSSTPTRSSFTPTEQDPTGAVYDQARKLLFVSVEASNEVDVISSVDGHRVATIPVQYPAGIDESADGSKIYVVSPYLTNIVTIDPNRLEVVGQTAIPQTGGVNQTGFLVSTLSTGEALLLIIDNFTTHTLLWNPSSNSFTSIAPSFPFSQVISRSADHTKALIYGTTTAGAKAMVYDAATGEVTSPASLDSIYSLALSPNGSQIVGIGLGQSTMFYDSQFNSLASIPLGGFNIKGAIYSLDGTRAYAMLDDTSTQAPIAVALDAKNFSLVGVVPSFEFGIALPMNGLVYSWLPFAIDETNMLFGGFGRGVGNLDLSSPGNLNPPLPRVSSLTPTIANPKTATPLQLSGAFYPNDQYGVYFGANPASTQAKRGTNISVASNNILNVTAPTAGGLLGPTNVTLTRSDGFFQVIPDAISYGPSLVRVDPDSGSAAGGDSIDLVGYGFDSSDQVTLGGKAATDPNLLTPSPSPTPTQTLSVATPSGTGDVDVVIRSAAGSTTIPSGFHYLTSSQTYSMPGALDAVIYDRPRHRLYISNEDHNRIEIFNLTTNSFGSAIPVGNQPTAIALTPDGAKLAVINSADETLSVLNPDTGQVISTYPAVTASDTACEPQIVGMVSAEPHRVLVDVACISETDSGAIHLINLDTGNLSCAGIAGCGSDNASINFSPDLAAMASTSDGIKVFFAYRHGQIAVLDFSANTFKTGVTSVGSHDAAANTDGSVFAASFLASNRLLSPLSLMAYDPYADAGPADFVLPVGEQLNASGSLLFVPQLSAVAIFDVHRGRLVRHISVPEGIPINMRSMALDETGTKIFLITSSGITIDQISQSPLSLATISPATGAPGSTVTLRGSGFESGATVRFGTMQALTSYGDTETLTATVPQSVAGPTQITIANPNGTTYSFDDAFNVQ